MSEDSADSNPASMMDLAFPVEGSSLAREHRELLAQAVERQLPWLAGTPGAGIHPFKLSQGSGPRAWVSKRTRLTLRLPRSRLADASALQGQALDLEGDRLVLGPPQARELLPWGTLYAHVVALEEAPSSAMDDVAAVAQAGLELAFLEAIDQQLRALGVQARAICGRLQHLDDAALQGFSLMLDGLSAAASVRVQAAGLGRHRRLGCGVFVPHKSAAAVGVPT